MDFFEKRRQPVYQRLLHLVAGEAARNEDAVEKFGRVNPVLAGETGKCVYVEPVAAVHHNNRIAAHHGLGRHPERKMEDETVAV
jgi:hypothetical protein